MDCRGEPMIAHALSESDTTSRPVVGGRPAVGATAESTPPRGSVTAELSGFSDATLEGIAVADGLVEVPPLMLPIASFGDTVVVTASRTEVRVVNAPVTTSVVPAATLETTASSNVGDVLRSVPGVNVIQLSARDVQVTSRQSTGTLANSQLVLMDGRSIYLDFFGMVMWDSLPANTGDIEQIEVVRGPASATWGANAMTGAVNIITRAPRDSVGTTVSMSGGWIDREAGSTVGRGAGTMFGTNATITRAPTDRLAYRISAGYFQSDTGRVPVIEDPRLEGATVGGAPYPLDGAGPFGAALANRGTSQHASVSMATAAFWSDVLTPAFHGYTDGYTLVNGSFGVRWNNGAVTTLLKVTNLFNQSIQQHIFGEILRRTVVGEVRFSL